MISNRFNFSQTLLSAVLMTIDALAMLCAFIFTTFVVDNIKVENYLWIGIIILFFFSIEKIYTLRYDFWQDTKKILKILFLVFLIITIVVSFTALSLDYKISTLFIFFLFSTLTIPLFKRVGKKLLFLIERFKIKVNVVSKSSVYKSLTKEIEKNWYLGFVNNDKDYDMVIISSKNFDTSEFQDIIKVFLNKTKDIYVIPYMEHLDFSHTTVVDYSNVRLSAIHIENRLLNYKNKFIKEFFEKILTLMIFPFVLMVHILLTILIKSDSKGSVLFKQKRLGKNSRPFTCYKYRTMYEDSQAVLDEYLEENPDEKEYYELFHKYKNDPRITKTGAFLRKTSLDELPQFYNVLRGDMNLIGPRPYMLNEQEELGKQNKDIILKTKPGITGLWQVSGRNDLPFDSRVELDKWYVQNWSLWIDFVIFVKTLKVVLTKVGAK